MPGPVESCPGVGLVAGEATGAGAQLPALLGSPGLGAAELVLEPPALVAPAVVANEGQTPGGAVADGGTDHRLQLAARQGDGYDCAETDAAEKRAAVQGLEGKAVQAA